MKTNGFDDLNKKLKEMEDGAKELEQTNSVSLEDLLSASFMRENTDYSNLDEFFEKSPFKDVEFEDIDDKELDEYVNQHSNLDSWQDMIDTAGQDYAIKKLGL